MHSATSPASHLRRGNFGRRLTLEDYNEKEVLMVIVDDEEE
jgi:hypothetical protein